MERYIADAAFSCDGCGRMSVVTWLTNDDPGLQRTRGHGDGSPEDHHKAHWSPPVGHQKTFPEVPEAIAEAATEAWTCHVTCAYRAATMLARAVVESAAKANGVERGTLQAKIDMMADKGLIRPAVAEQAHEIRHLGNSTAHGDLDDEVTLEDSDEVLYFMEQVLNEVFQAPARTKRFADRRAARRQAKSVEQ
ncbi:MAG: DUF4145 domain-containing protein [Corynebacterium sp.]|uniref:DUF4145 domain-containing protein n=1 Tax=Corynebacterium sp. TaxID=1720 RepID=UPI003F0FE03F